jgi:hypothetical protein
MPPWGTEEEEREYWDKTDIGELTRAVPNGKRKGWKASMLYLTDRDARGLDALVELERESASSIFRQAIREYGARIAKRHGTTWAALTAEPPTKGKGARRAGRSKARTRPASRSRAA